MWCTTLREEYVEKGTKVGSNFVLDQASRDDEWIVESEEPCLSSDREWLDEVMEESDYLDVTTINNIALIVEKEEVVNDPLTTKKQRVGSSYK